MKCFEILLICRKMFLLCEVGPLQKKSIRGKEKYRFTGIFQYTGSLTRPCFIGGKTGGWNPWLQQVRWSGWWFDLGSHVHRNTFRLCVSTWRVIMRQRVFHVSVLWWIFILMVYYLFCHWILVLNCILSHLFQPVHCFWFNCFVVENRLVS